MTRILHRAIRSRRKFANAPAVKKELSDVLSKKTGPELKKKFNAVVSDWKSDVKFRSMKKITADNIRVFVWPTGSDKLVWFYVDKGTKPHPIKAKNAPFLSFMGGTYIPKTKPIAQTGGPGITVGGWQVFTKKVNHPGTKAREFTETIQDEYKPTFQRDMENAFRRGINKSKPDKIYESS